MNTTSPALLHHIGGVEALDLIRPLWEKLRLHHLPLLPEFAGELRQVDFESRKREVLAKAADGKLRIESVQHEAGTSLIAYCLCTVTTKGRGEVDSIFVEQEFRGRGLGTALLRHALAWQDAAGAVSKVVMVAHANREALALYQRFGFLPRAILLQQP